MPLDRKDYEEAFSDGAHGINIAFGNAGPETRSTQFKTLQEWAAEDESVLALIETLNTPEKAKHCVETFGLPYHVSPDAIEPDELNDWISFNDEAAVSDQEKNTLHFLPSKMHQAWLKLQREFRALAKDHPEIEDPEARRVMISSAYRSPAFQLGLLAYYYTEKAKTVSNKTLAEVFKTVAPPFASRHAQTPPAIDIPQFMSRTSGNPFGIKGLADDALVYEMPAYKLFLELALEHGFAPSYPKGVPVNSGKGEPWEFLYIPGPPIIDFETPPTALRDYPGKFPENDPDFKIKMPPVKREEWTALIIKIFSATREQLNFLNFFVELIKREALAFGTVDAFLAHTKSLSQEERKIILHSFNAARRVAQGVSGKEDAHEGRRQITLEEVPDLIAVPISSDSGGITADDLSHSCLDKNFAEQCRSFNQLSLSSLFKSA